MTTSTYDDMRRLAEEAPGKWQFSFTSASADYANGARGFYEAARAYFLSNERDDLHEELKAARALAVEDAKENADYRRRVDAERDELRERMKEAEGWVEQYRKLVHYEQDLRHKAEAALRSAPQMPEQRVSDERVDWFIADVEGYYVEEYRKYVVELASDLKACRAALRTREPVRIPKCKYPNCECDARCDDTPSRDVRAEVLEEAAREADRVQRNVGACDMNIGRAIRALIDKPPKCDTCGEDLISDGMTGEHRCAFSGPAHDEPSPPDIRALAEAVKEGRAIPPAPFDEGDDVLIPLATGTMRAEDIEPRPLVQDAGGKDEAQATYLKACKDCDDSGGEVD